VTALFEDYTETPQYPSLTGGAESAVNEGKEKSA
jgi:hypothetical protein